MAPEVVLKQNYDFKVDSWSLVLQIIIDTFQFIPTILLAQSQSEQIKQITKNEINVQVGIDEDLQILILALLTKDPQQRPTIQQLFKSKQVKKQMKLYKIFNKYENPAVENKALSKNLEIKINDVNGPFKKCMADSQKSSEYHHSNQLIQHLFPLPKQGQY